MLESQVVKTYTVTVSTIHKEPFSIFSVVKYNFANGVAFIQDTEGDIFIYPMHTIKDIYMYESVGGLENAEGVDTAPSLL